MILDSKVSLAALMEAFETEDEESRSAAFDRHVAQVRTHVDSLAKKEYWSVLSSTPDMVVMVMQDFAFLPAIEREPDLTEWALRKNVIIVTPPALLALLKVVEMSWQQISVEKTARQISDLGKEMYERLAVFAGHYVNVGNSLRQAVERYDSSVGSWDKRVEPAARRFTELNVPITRKLPGGSAGRCRSRIYPETDGRQAGGSDRRSDSIGGDNRGKPDPAARSSS